MRTNNKQKLKSMVWLRYRIFYDLLLRKTIKAVHFKQHNGADEELQVFWEHLKQGLDFLTTAPFTFFQSLLVSYERF